MLVSVNPITDCVCACVRACVCVNHLEPNGTQAFQWLQDFSLHSIPSDYVYLNASFPCLDQSYCLVSVMWTAANSNPARQITAIAT